MSADLIPVPADVVALLPQFPLMEFERHDHGCDHDVTWNPQTLNATCRECGRDDITPDDIDLPGDVRQRIEVAAIAAGLIR